MSESEPDIPPIPPVPPAPPAEALDVDSAGGALPGWVPSAVVAGVVLLLLGVVGGQMRPDGDAGELVSSVTALCKLLGLLSLGSGYFAFLLTRASMALALEALALSLATLLFYGVAWSVLFSLLAGDTAALFFVEPTGLEGRGALGLALVGLLVAAAGAAGCFHRSVSLVWPYFRAGIALNVLAMLHLVVLLLGTVSALNVRFAARVFGGGIDLTTSKRFSLTDHTLKVLENIEGTLDVVVLDHGGARGSTSAITGRCRDLLREYAVHFPAIRIHNLDPYRKEDDARRVLEETGLRGVLDGVTGSHDVIAFSYRPSGQTGDPRTFTVEVNQEFVRQTALGAEQFEGEGIITNSIRDLVFTTRRVYFTMGHGERSIQAPGAEDRTGRAVSDLADALRRNNCVVERLDLTRTPSVPADADLLVVASPASPFGPAEAEAVRAYLGGGGSALVLIDPPSSYDKGVPRTGLEDLMAAHGIELRRDVEIVSWFAEFGIRGVQFTPIPSVIAGPEEVGKHPATEALRSTSLRMEFPGAHPVFKADRIPEGVVAQEILFAPREVQGRKPFGYNRTIQRPTHQVPTPVPGDITDRRLGIAVAAERSIPGSGKAGGRLIVVGDGDFLSDNAFEGVPLNRTLAQNLASWAMRRDLIVIDPRTLESDIITLRDVHKELSFWIAVAALPLITLGVAVGVWWSRRR